MRNQKKLQLEQLDKKLRPFLETEKTPVPEGGWLHAIRKTLNMSLEQLGQKLKITKQGARQIEESESSGSITIKSLKEVARVLDMQLVYAFVPKQGTLEDLVNRKAEALARKIVLRTNQNMKLENQGNSEEQINRAIIDLANELKAEMNKSLWD